MQIYENGERLAETKRFATAEQMILADIDLERLAQERAHEYDRAAITRWLAVFLRRFFETSQFKRSALPNAPKAGSGGSLSPRSDWGAPSDGHADAWLEELEREVPTEARKEES